MDLMHAPVDATQHALLVVLKPQAIGWQVRWACLLLLNSQSICGLC